MTGKDTEGMKQTARRRAALIADQLTGAAAAPSEATNGVLPTRAVLAQLMLRCGVPLLAVTAVAALMWRASKQYRRRTAR
ncbi:hypothetical protein ACFVX6_19280 [Streptomyces sp. NPDC058289]|uniref:hypothetical protein n=1 Tax=Streptomyces sp. NPDC058289 TaxID=3346425 RepID=UPI0036E4182D